MSFIFWAYYEQSMFNMGTSMLGLPVDQLDTSKMCLLMFVPWAARFLWVLYSSSNEETCRVSVYKQLTALILLNTHKGRVAIKINLLSRCLVVSNQVSSLAVYVASSMIPGQAHFQCFECCILKCVIRLLWWMLEQNSVMFRLTLCKVELHLICSKDVYCIFLIDKS